MTVETLLWGQGFAWAELQARERTFSLQIPDAARRNLARSLQLEHLTRLEARLTVKAWLDGLCVDGWVEGVAGRLCGLTLEPFDETVKERLTLRLVPHGSPNAPQDDGGEVVVDLEGEDPPEVVDGAVIDLGAYVVEAFAVGLDPFPRKPGAVFVAPEEPVAISPFAALKGLADPSKRS